MNERFCVVCFHTSISHYDDWAGAQCLLASCTCAQYKPMSNLDYLEYKLEEKQNLHRE